MRTQTEIADLLARERVVLRREQPQLRTALEWRVRCGELIAILPGVYVDPGAASDPDVMVMAVARAWPGTVFTGMTAARLTFWPGRSTTIVTAATRSSRAPHRGLRWERRLIPPELVTRRGGLLMTAPSLTALDLSDLANTEALDVALRKRVATPDTLRDALRLTAHRRRNAQRWVVLLDSRDGPWSYPERLGHRLLRAEGIRGWRANHPFCDSNGCLYYIDIAFERLRLAIEIDGRRSGPGCPFEHRKPGTSRWGGPSRG